MIKYIDLSVLIEDLMPVYPDDEALRLNKIYSFQKDGFVNHRLITGMHSGTHIDGPMHLTESNKLLSNIPPDHFFGKGIILNAKGEKVIGLKKEYEKIIEKRSIVLLYTGFSKNFSLNSYFTDYPTISKELARLFVEKKIKMICIEQPSPDKPPFEIHKYLLKNKVLIAENLTNLEKLLRIKKFEIIALPLKIKADSSLSRIVAKINFNNS